MAVLVPVGATRAPAQTISAFAVVGHLDRQLGGRVFGPSVAVSLPLGRSPLGLEIGLERMRRGSEEFGRACGSLPPPGTCHDERVHEQISATALSLGLSVPLFGSGSVRLRGASWIGAVRMSTSRVGLASGSDLSAHRIQGRFEAGVDAAWRPWSGVPIAVRGGGRLGWQGPFSERLATDSYLPFEQGSGLAKGWLGLAWHFGG